MSLSQCTAAINPGNRIGGRDTKVRTGAQDVDVAAKCARIGFENCHHRLIHRQTAVRTNATRKSPQRFTAFHQVIITY